MPQVELSTPADEGIIFNCDETGSTFLENSLLKARTLYELTGRPVIADDSGLCVNALDGAPGIFSARYGSAGKGEDLEISERNAFLLDNMVQYTDPADRTAFFVCCMSAIIDDYRVYTVQERVEGRITTSPFGEGGFGYDPIFFLPGHNMTVAELPDEEKNKVSHRGRAAARLAILLKGI